MQYLELPIAAVTDDIVKFGVSAAIIGTLTLGIDVLAGQLRSIRSLDSRPNEREILVL